MVFFLSFYVPLVDSSCFDGLFRFDVLRNNCSYQGVPFCWHVERLFLITCSHSCEMVVIYHVVFLYLIVSVLTACYFSLYRGTIVPINEFPFIGYQVPFCWHVERLFLLRVRIHVKWFVFNIICSIFFIKFALIVYNMGAFQ